VISVLLRDEKLRTSFVENYQAKRSKNGGNLCGVWGFRRNNTFPFTPSMTSIITPTNQKWAADKSKSG
jgi:hypothetical protein